MKARILVIEDNSVLRTMLAEILTSAGDEVLQAADGREGEALLARDHIDLILTDVLMPNQDGIETIIAVRKTRPRIPIIAMTGGYEIEPDYYLRLAAAFGATRVLRKPFDIDELQHCVNELLPSKPAPG